MGGKHITDLVIDAGVAMTRAALICDDTVVRIWIGPARGDEARYGMAMPGQHYLGKVTHIDRTLMAAFLNLGNRTEAMMRITDTGKIPVEGQSIGVEITRAAGHGKRAIVIKHSDMRADDGRSTPTPPTLGPLTPAPDSLIMAWQMLVATRACPPDRITVSSGVAKSGLQKLLNQPDLRIDIDDHCFERSGAPALAASFIRHVTLPSGGVLTLDQGEGLTAIDVDSAAMGAPSRARLNDRLNREAASAMIAQLALRRIGGQVVIDFLPLTKPAAAQFDKWLRAACQALPGFARGGWTPSGLFSFTLPREMPSLLDQYTTISDSAPVPGRVFTTGYLMRQCLCTLEARLRKNPSTKFTVHLSHQLLTCYHDSPEWRQRLEQQYGARAEFIPDPQFLPHEVKIDEDF